MNHIHVLVNGSFTASDDLVLPKISRSSSTRCPTARRCAKEHELSGDHAEGSRRANPRECCGNRESRAHGPQLPSERKTWPQPRIRVSQAVRESYINGMDTELLSSSLLLMSGPNVDPTVAMALGVQSGRKTTV